MLVIRQSQEEKDTSHSDLPMTDSYWQKFQTFKIVRAQPQMAWLWDLTATEDQLQEVHPLPCDLCVSLHAVAPSLSAKRVKYKFQSGAHSNSYVNN